jgi:hypothetical protein
MEHFFLNFTIPQSNTFFQHGDGIILTGSCFSDEISNKLKNSGHTVYTNPYGTIFHPSILALNVMNALSDQPDGRIFTRDGKFYTWNASTLLFGNSEEELQQKILQIKTDFKQQIKSARLLIVTFGTAWGYELNETQEIVANCHKMPSQLFTKFLSSPYELVKDWILAIEQIRGVNPDIHIIFTVSPVRHTRDGLIENNLSKSRLIEAVQQLTLEENTSYFPSYELVIDVLRDYRFFKEDRVHPNEEAIEFVWKKFEETYCNDSTIELNHLVGKVNKMRKHKSTENDSKHLELVNLKRKELSEKNPRIDWK